MIGVLIGLHTKALAHDACEMACNMECTEESGDHHHDSTPSETSDDSKCPVEHHHHFACNHSNPLVAQFDFACRLSPPSFSYVGVLWLSETAPDGPFLSEDKPPLI